MANPLKELDLKINAFQSIQEVPIAATPDKVWKTLINAGAWFGFEPDRAAWPKMSVELVPGGRWIMEREGVQSFIGHVTHIEPGKLLRVSGPIAMTHLPINTVCIFELQPQNGGKSTLLRFGQRGFGYMDESVPTRTKEGWTKLFANLKEAAEAA